MLASCSINNQIESNTSESNSILFILLRISNDSNSTKHKVELLSKTTSVGKIKKVNDNAFHSENYLTIQIFNNRKLIDTRTIEHPLYKHLEYSDANNSLAAKDTIIDNAEFFFRVQAQGNKNEIRVFETLKNKQKEELAIIKLY